jgi:hypothetical protein
MGFKYKNQMLTKKRIRKRIQSAQQLLYNSIKYKSIKRPIPFFSSSKWSKFTPKKKSLFLEARRKGDSLKMLIKSKKKSREDQILLSPRVKIFSKGKQKLFKLKLNKNQFSWNSYKEEKKGKIKKKNIKKDIKTTYKVITINKRKKKFIITQIYKLYKTTNKKDIKILLYMI